MGKLGMLVQYEYLSTMYFQLTLSLPLQTIVLLLVLLTLLTNNTLQLHFLVLGIIIEIDVASAAVDSVAHVEQQTQKYDQT
jgi:hypothetical protein